MVPTRDRVTSASVDAAAACVSSTGLASSPHERMCRLDLRKSTDQRLRSFLGLHTLWHQYTWSQELQMGSSVCPRLWTLTREQRLVLDSRVYREDDAVTLDDQLRGINACEDGARCSPHLLPDGDCV